MWGNSYGWMSPGIVHSAVSLNRRLLRLAGGFVEAENSYSTGAIAKMLPEIVGSADPRSTDWPVVLEHADEIVLWGANPLVTNDVDWMTTLHRGRRALKAFAASGRRITSVDPVETETAKLLRAETVALHPGTDAALAVGLASVLWREGLADRAFLANAVSGWERIVETIEAGFDETAAAEATGVDVEKIRRLARRWASGRTMIMGGWGPQRSPEGENAPWALWVLASFLGQIGLPGGGIGTNYHYSDGGVPASGACGLSGIPSRPTPLDDLPWSAHAAAQRCIAGTLPVAAVSDALLRPGATTRFHGREIRYPSIELVMWAGGNPFAHQCDTNRLAEAFRRMKTVIVTDTHWTPAARMADIVFPAASLFERRDLTGIGSYANLGVAAIEPVRPPAGDAKPDYEIFAGLARHMDPKLGEAFTEGLDAEGWMARLWREARCANAARGIIMPTLEALRRRGVFLYPEPKSTYVAFADFRADPVGSPLSTPSGKIELDPQRLRTLRAGVMTNLPWGAEGRRMRNPHQDIRADELILLTTKSPLRLHSQCEAADADASDIRGGVPVPELSKLRPLPEPETVIMHPDDANARGLREGDLVVLENARGRLLARARLEPVGIRGTVLLRHGAWWDPRSGLDVRGQANVLTSDEPTSDFSRGNAVSGWAVRAFRADAAQRSPNA